MDRPDTRSTSRSHHLSYSGSVCGRLGHQSTQRREVAAGRFGQAARATPRVGERHAPLARQVPVHSAFRSSTRFLAKVTADCGH
ncbi:hypothetical protein J6590_038338 [Homalodisca vitripennis]|nr:hypothetical protein J6590_038338 [Homalodisca vitripennis]